MKNKIVGRIKIERGTDRTRCKLCGEWSAYAIASAIALLAVRAAQITGMTPEYILAQAEWKLLEEKNNVEEEENA